MAEESRVVEICLQDCLNTHFEKTVIGAWSVRFHVHNRLFRHVDYGN